MNHTHTWIWHQSPRPGQAPVAVCMGCGVPGFDALAEATREHEQRAEALVCPRCYSEGRDGCCLALEWRRTRAAAEGAPDPDDTGLPLWQQVDHCWSRRHAADQRAWQRERTEHEQRAELQRQRVAELEAERDELVEESRRWRVVLQASEAQSALARDAMADERDRLAAEVDRLRGMVAAADEYGDRHVIDLREDGWTIAHPLSCRAAGLFACPLNAAASALDGPPAGLGKYAVDAVDGRLVVGERIAETRWEASRP